MSTEADEIKRNIEDVRKRVEKSARNSGRHEQDITLIAVTKTVDTDRIRAALAEGILHLGENRVQEMCEKVDIIKEPCFWHLIGHLQTNKVKYIVDKVSMIHSVDSLELAREIQKRGVQAGKMLEILVQVNVAGETTKFGLEKEKVVELVREISLLDHVRVKGLMTIAPLAEDPDTVRPVFRELRDLLIDIKKENIDNIDMDFLSMGMSHDFEAAIEEGSNMVRVGTAIFGKRG